MVGAVYTALLIMSRDRDTEPLTRLSQLREPGAAAPVKNPGGRRRHGTGTSWAS